VVRLTFFCALAVPFPPLEKYDLCAPRPHLPAPWPISTPLGKFAPGGGQATKISLRSIWVCIREKKVVHKEMRHAFSEPIPLVRSEPSSLRPTIKLFSSDPKLVCVCACVVVYHEASDWTLAGLLGAAQPQHQPLPPPTAALPSTNLDTLDNLRHSG